MQLAVEEALFYPTVAAAADYKALNVLINEALIKLFCEKMKIEVDPADVDNQIKAIIDSSPGITSEGDSKAASFRRQTLDSFKARLKKQQLLRIFYGRVIAPRVKDLEKEVEQQKLINRANQNLTVVTAKVLVLCKD